MDFFFILQGWNERQAIQENYDNLIKVLNNFAPKKDNAQNSNKINKLAITSLKLLMGRREVKLNLEADPMHITVLYREIRIKIKKDLFKYRNELISEIISKNSTTKKIRKELSIGRIW